METHVGFYFKKISERLEKRANEKGKKRDITYAQGKILWYLHSRSGEKIYMRDIEKYFDCSHATVFGLLKRLEEKGRVEILPDERDKRAKTVRPTEQEKDNYSKLKRERRVLEETLLKGFTDEEKQSVSEYLERIYQNLE